MIRKWMSTLLALLLVVMVPMCAMADKQHTLTVIPGDDLRNIQEVADLSDVLSLSYIYSDEAGAISIGLSEEEMVTIAASADENGLYLHSNALSDDVLYLDWEDSLELFSQLAAEEMGAEAAQAFQQSMEAQLAGLFAAGSAGAVVSEEVSPETFEEIFADDPAMIAFGTRMVEEIDIEEGSYKSDKRDTATGRVAANLTDEDLLELTETKFMRSIIEELIKSQDAEMSGDEVKATTDALLEEVKNIFREMELEGGMSIYTVDDGDVVVGFELYVPMVFNVEGENVTFVLQFDYNRLTTSNGVSYKASFETGLPQEENGMLTIVYDHFKGSDSKYTSKGMVALMVDGQQFTITYDATTENAARTRLASVYMRDGANAIVEPAASERPLITFKVVSKDADPAVLQAIKNADSTTAVDVLKLTEDGLMELVNGMQIRVTRVVSKVMSALPESVLMLMMENQ